MAVSRVSPEISNWGLLEWWFIGKEYVEEMGLIMQSGLDWPLVDQHFFKRG